MTRRRPIDVATVSMDVAPSAQELDAARKAMLKRALEDGYTQVAKVRHVGSAVRDDMPGAYAHHFTAVAS